MFFLYRTYLKCLFKYTFKTSVEHRKMQESKKRKKKSYYCQKKKSKNDHDLEVGLKGFLITCNKNEAKTVVEAYKLFNEYADQLYGPDNFEVIFFFICIK